MSRAGRSRQSRAIGIVRELPRTAVKINVNFAVELISPAPINPTSSRRLSLSLFPRVSFHDVPFVCARVSLSLFLSFPPFSHGPCYRRSITDISSHPTLSRRPEPSSSFLKLENFRGEKKLHVSAALGKKPPSSFPGSFSAGIRALFVAIIYVK